jgi:TolB protein
MTARLAPGARLALALAVVVAVASVAIVSASASFHGKPGKIAFDFWSGTDQEIGVINADGTGRTVLTNTPSVSDHTPRWSRDGNKIVYMSEPAPAEPYAAPDIWVMDADGSNQTQLTFTPLGEFVPAWTADGRIVFCGESDGGDVDIYLMNADGSGRIRLTDSPSFDCFPAPAPSGDRVSFTSLRSGNSQVFTMKLDGSKVRQLTTGPLENLASDWSPSGNQIVFLRRNSSRIGDNDLWTIHTDGGHERRLTSDGAARPKAFPTWSPDGSTVVFGGIVDPGVYNIFSIDARTGEEQTLIKPVNPDSWSVAYPSWQAVRK